MMNIYYCFVGGNKMKISFSTLGCPRWSWSEITSTAKDLGYNGIEVRGVGKDISVPSVPAFGKERIANTIDKLTALELAIPCLDSDCLIYLPEKKEQTLKEVKAYLALANKLSVPYVRVFAAAAVPEPVTPIDENFVAQQAKELADLAGSYGVTLLLETHGIWSDSKKLAQLLSTVGSDHIGALWDIHHPYRFMGESPDTTYNHLGPWIKHVHIKDSILDNSEKGYRYVPCGKGDIPVKESIELLKEKGYQGFYSLEWVKRWDISLEEPGIIFAHFTNYMDSFK